MGLEQVRTNGLEPYGRFYGEYVGIVKSTEDELGINRLLLYIPEVMGPEGAYVWALPKGQFSGVNYGSQIMPQVGDSVWVTYRHGISRHAIWEHGYYSKEQKPEDFKELDTFGFITPNGTKVLLKDSDNTVLVSTPKGNSISIIEEGSKIILKNQESISISIEGKEVKVNDQYLTIGDEIKESLESLHEHLVAYSTQILALSIPAIGTNSPTPDIGLVQWKEKLDKILTKYT